MNNDNRYYFIYIKLWLLLIIINIKINIDLNNNILNKIGLVNAHVYWIEWSISKW